MAKNKRSTKEKILEIRRELEARLSKKIVAHIIDGLIEDLKDLPDNKEERIEKIVKLVEGVIASGKLPETDVEKMVGTGQPSSIVRESEGELKQQKEVDLRAKAKKRIEAGEVGTTVKDLLSEEKAEE